MFRIHDIVVWIRILLFSSLSFKMPAKNRFFNTIFSACYFLKVHLNYFSKIKSHKESQNSRIQDFSFYFCMIIEGSGSGAGSESGPIPLTSGSGSGRPKNTWIRIRIRNTGHENIYLYFHLLISVCPETNKGYIYGDGNICWNHRSSIWRLKNSWHAFHFPHHPSHHPWSWVKLITPACSLQHQREVRSLYISGI